MSVNVYTYHGILIVYFDLAITALLQVPFKTLDHFVSDHVSLKNLFFSSDYQQCDSKYIQQIPQT